VCYNTPGQYPVTLIATNSFGSDTLTLNNYMTVYPYPAPQGIAQSGDTLIANQGAVSYQWYHDGVLIPGATNYFYVQWEGGDFNIVATDANGCEVEAVIYDVLASVLPAAYIQQAICIFPNPVREKLEIRFPAAFAANAETAFDISIYNLVGEKIYAAPGYLLSSPTLTVSAKDFSAGVYVVKIQTGDFVATKKFVVEK
jgi:PKD repeat protein